MALGVGSADSLYKDTGYAYLETTNLSYVGVPPDELAGGVVLTSEPLIIPVGNGTTVYTSGAETSYINEMSTLSEQKVQGMDTQVKPLVSDLTAKQEQIASLEAQMQALRSSGNIGAYNAQVSEPQRACFGLQCRTCHVQPGGRPIRDICRCPQLHHLARVRSERHLCMGEGKHAGEGNLPVFQKPRFIHPGPGSAGGQ